MHKKERELHTKFDKAKRVRKLMLNEDNINKFKEYKRDYDSIMKSVHKIDKELKDLKKEYSKLLAQEDKLLEIEFKLEEQKAELYHKREQILSKVTQLTKNINTKIAQAQRDY